MTTKNLSIAFASLACAVLSAAERYPIRVNQAGYLESDPEKQFYYVGSAEEFEVVDANGKSFTTKITGTLTSSGSVTTSKWTIVAGTDAHSNDQMRYQVDFDGQSGTVRFGRIPESVPTNERLRIKVGDHLSSTFIVSKDVYTMAKDASIKFLGIQRSGNSDSWFHGPSHTKDGAGQVVDEFTSSTTELTSIEGALQGGWYDCGDHLKESQTQAYAFMTLAVMSATNPSKDVDHYAYNHAEFVKTDSIPDVLREAKHGADFFLRAFRFAKGVVDDMPVSIGSFGSDHGSWGRPEIQDYFANVTSRGGPHERDVRLGELGSNISGMIVTGLAILSKDYAKYDKDFADSCLLVAERMYDFAKSLALGKDSYDDGKPFVHNKKAAGWSSPAYNGNNEYHDDMALASVALLYATGKKKYADDMIRTNMVEQEFLSGAGFFEGGWFASNEHGAFTKNVKNTSWANSYAYATYALYKLILADKNKATTKYGLTEEEWLNAIEDCVANMIANLGDVSGYGEASTTTIELPSAVAQGISWKSHSISFDPIWYSMMTDHIWIYNRNQAGNIFEVLAYADVVADIERQGTVLPILGTPNWKADEMRQLGINQLNYMFGVNPWDISFVYGVGDKNDAHPHHRAANPEGRNAYGFSYKYVCPVGGLIGGTAPALNNSWIPDGKSWEDYLLSETCLDATATFLSALTIVSNGGNDYYEKQCNNCKTGNATPFTENDVYAAAYHYVQSTSSGKLDAYSITIMNNTFIDRDSAVAYIYFDATEENIEAGDIAFDVGICQHYDIAGFSKPCENGSELIEWIRSSKPEKIETTYNKDTQKYTWVQAIPLPDLDIGRRIRIDVDVVTKIGDDILQTPSKVNVGEGWSFTSHAATKDAPAYAGTPKWDKDQGDFQEAPKAPYIVIRSKGNLLWGYDPGNTTDDRVGTAQIAQKPSVQMQLSRNTLFVQANAQGSKTVKIFDVLGNQLLTQTFNGTSAEVNLANIPHRGALIARVSQNGKTLATQSIKIK